jgi:hypothetical protein
VVLVAILLALAGCSSGTDIASSDSGAGGMEAADGVTSRALKDAP